MFDINEIREMLEKAKKISKSRRDEMIKHTQRLESSINEWEEILKTVSIPGLDKESVSYTKIFPKTSQGIFEKESYDAEMGEYHRIYSLINARREELASELKKELEVYIASN